MTIKLVRLPIGEAVATTYADHADILSVLAIDPRTRGWIFSNFMQVNVEPPGSLKAGYKFDFYRDTRNAWADCPHLPRNTIHYRYLSDFCTPRDFIVSSVAKESYVTLYLDLFFVSASLNFQRNHFAHSVFVTGFDLDAQIFRISFHGAPHGAYANFAVPFEEFDQAFDGVKAYCGDEYTDISWDRALILHTFQFDERYEDICRVTLGKHLTDYITSTNTHVANGVVDKYALKFGGGCITNNIYGDSVYETLLWIVDKNLATQTGFDLRSFHFMASHKRILRDRIAFLREHGWRVSDALVDAAVEIKDLADKLFGLYAVNSFRFDQSRMVACRELIVSLRQHERPLLQQLLDAL